MSYYAPPSDMALLSVKYFPQVIKNRHFKVPQNGKGRGESPESPVNLMQFKFRVVVSVVDRCSFLDSVYFFGFLSRKTSNFPTI